MSRDVSAAALRAVLSQETAEVVLVFLRITHPSIGTYYIVNNNVAIIRSDATYQPFPFQISLPDEDDTSFPQITLLFDNIDQTISLALLNLQGQATVEFDVALASQPNTIEAGPFTFTLMQAAITAATVSCTLSIDDDIFSQNCPGIVYNPTNSPGLF